jgi:hypothetical protein
MPKCQFRDIFSGLKGGHIYSGLKGRPVSILLHNIHFSKSFYSFPHVDYEYFVNKLCIFQEKVDIGKKVLERVPFVGVNDKPAPT